MTINELQEFLRNYLLNFMCGDVEKAILGKENILAALGLASYTEVLGGFATGDGGLSATSGKNFDAGLGLLEWDGDGSYYRDLDKKLFLAEAGKSKEATTVYKIVRCGLVHEYLGKGIVYVHNNSDRVDHCVLQDAGIGWIDHEGQRRLRFHTNAYYRDFRAAAVRLIDNVGTDPAVFANVKKSVERILSRCLTET